MHDVVVPGVVPSKVHYFAFGNVKLHAPFGRPGYNLVQRLLRLGPLLLLPPWCHSKLAGHDNSSHLLVQVIGEDNEEERAHHAAFGTPDSTAIQSGPPAAAAYLSKRLHKRRIVYTLTLRILILQYLTKFYIKSCRKSNVNITNQTCLYYTHYSTVHFLHYNKLYCN